MAPHACRTRVRAVALGAVKPRRPTGWKNSSAARSGHDRSGRARPDHLAGVRLDALAALIWLASTRRMAVCQLRDDIAIHLRLGVRVADATVVGEEDVPRLGGGGDGAHEIFGALCRRPTMRPGRSGSASRRRFGGRERPSLQTRRAAGASATSSIDLIASGRQSCANGADQRLVHGFGHVAAAGAPRVRLRLAWIDVQIQPVRWLVRVTYSSPMSR